MAEQLTREQIAQAAEIRTAPPARLRNDPVDRTFGLPKALYVATVGLYLGFIGLLGTAFANPEMAIPVAIFGLFIVAGFGVPAIWTRLAPETASKPLGWDRFMKEGIMTAYGRTKGRDAIVQVLILPTLIFVWGVIVVTIAALV